MNAVAWRFVTAYRDQFGLRGASGRALDRVRHALMAPLRRASAVLHRPVTLEQGVWLLIAALLIGFIVVLVLGATGVGRGGR